jgi:hemoglobin
VHSQDAPLFDALVGDSATCLALAKAFYARVQRDPVLRPLFPGKSLRCAIEQLAAFLVQLLGGPAEDTQDRWALSLRDSHRRFAIGPRERDAWMRLMIATLDEAPLADASRRTLRQFFEQASAYMINTTRTSHTGLAGHAEPPPAAAPSLASLPHRDALEGELSRCWQAQQHIDAAVAAIHDGLASRAIALVEEPILRAYIAQRPAVHASLLALMIGSSSGSGRAELHEYVRQQLARTPALVREHFSHDRTLLHAAAAAGDAGFVALLLKLGADVSAGVHSPLYCVGNECLTPSGADVVRLLVQAGADVNAAEGPKRCTALHMAARRGNVDVAAALLDCGADIDSRDSNGVTPLGRALNCRKPDVAALLQARGADATAARVSRARPTGRRRSGA